MFRRQKAMWQLAEILVITTCLFTAVNSPASGANTRQTAKQTFMYRVSEGECLWTIAQKHDVNLQDLIRWNKLKKPDLLRTGQALVISTHNIELDEAVVATRNSSTGKQIPVATKEAASMTETLSDKEMALLARIIYAEARGEDFEGQVAVGAVVMNRLKHPQFPKSVSEVIYQPGAFSATNERQFKLEPDHTAWEAAQAAADGIDPSYGAIYYYNPVTARDRWIKTRPVLKVIGNHNFAT